MTVGGRWLVLRSEATKDQQSAVNGHMDIRQFEREAIEQALREADHNKSRAARMLGLSRQALDRRMEKFGIE